jgi:hypothetical protein
LSSWKPSLAQRTFCSPWHRRRSMVSNKFTECTLNVP